MDFTSEIKGIQKDWITEQCNIILSVNEESALLEANELQGVPLTVSIKKKRNKRSLDANAYAWVLMSKIADKTKTDKWTVYLEMLKRYSNSFTHIIVKPNAIERVKEEFRTCIDLGEVSVNGMQGHQLQVYYGSSTFDTKEMATLIDGIVSECKELDIPTMPDDELERMIKMWGK